MCKITVFTATYNREKTLERLYNSLKKQTFKNFEWIVIDDGSTDSTRELIDKFRRCNNFFEIIYLEQNGLGKHVAMNKAVENAMVEKLKQGHKTYDILISQANKGDLVDLEIFSKAMKRYYKETGKSKPHTVIKNTKNRLERVEKTQYDSLVGNIESLEKLWNGIGL